MVRRIAVCAAVAMLGLAWTSAGEAQLSNGDRAFILEAADGGAMEVSLGRLAAGRAASDAVRQFGQRMVADHGAANAQLGALAARKGVALPAEPGQRNRAMQDQLASRAGWDFDRAYMLEMVRDHDEDVSAFERALPAIQDPELRAWVAQTLPTLREHRRLAHETNALVAAVPGRTPAVGAMPSALPAAAVVVTPAEPWCQGGWRSGQGTNFGTCGR